MKKRILCLLLLCCLAATLFAVTASAAGEVKCPKGHTDVKRLDNSYGRLNQDEEVNHYPMYICNTCAAEQGFDYFFNDYNSPKPHTYVWKQRDGAYVRRCMCGYWLDSSKLSLTIRGADRVCATQDYTYSFTLPEGLSEPGSGYEFQMLGSDIPLTEENGVYTGTLEAEWYNKGESSFIVSVMSKTADGTLLKFEKTVTLLANHVEGTAATCTAPAVCEVCGASYGDVDADNHTDIIHVEKNDATETTEGNIEYWFCADCGKYFSDPNFSQEITQAETVIPKLTKDEKLGKDDGKKNAPAKEAEVTKAPSATPQTDDGSGYAQLIAISALSVCAAASAAVLLKGRKKSSDNNK